MWVPTMVGPGGSASLGAENWLTPHGMSGVEAETGKVGAGGEFAKQATQWMTPNVPNGGRHVPQELVASKGMTADGQKRTVGLESQSKYWSSPRASMATNGSDSGSAQRQAKGLNLGLKDQAKQWPTPAARDHKGTNSEQHMTRTDGRTDARTMPINYPTLS